MDDLSIGTVATIVIGVVLAIVVLIAIARTVRVVSQATAGIVERLGRYHRTLDPGLHFLFPFVDQLRTTVDLREQVVAFPNPIGSMGAIAALGSALEKAKDASASGPA